MTKILNLKITTVASKAKYLQTYLYYLNNLDDSVFDDCAKDKIILNYDIWFKYLMNVESYIFQSTDEDSVIDYIQCQLSIVSSNLNDFVQLNSNNKDYCKTYTKVYKEIISGLFNALTNLVHNIPKTDIDLVKIYSELCTWLSLYLQCIVYAVYEIQLIKTESGVPFISVADFHNEFDCEDFCFISDRAKIYKKYFNISKFKIRNYSRRPVPDECLNMFTKNGFEIIELE